MSTICPIRWSGSGTTISTWSRELVGRLAASIATSGKHQTQGRLRMPPYLGLFSPAVSTACSSALFQPEEGLYSFIALARTSVFLPRSF